ncbi:hypothetical protein HMPREF3170_09440 [Corynebacterium sp. HMSC08D02]|nr:hypothetical protein HMPREF3170_09440 [Corynebacterium sp. HMSC08D02]
MLAVDKHFDGVRERGCLLGTQVRTHRDTGGVEELQQTRVTVGDTLDHDVVVWGDRAQRLSVELRHGAVGGGDGVAVWVAGRVVEVGVEALQHEFRNGVLEDLGVVMHLVPRVSERFHEECFDEAVTANHRDGVRAAFLRQRNGRVRLMVYVPMLSKLLDGVRHAREPKPHVIRQHLGGHLRV